MPISIEVEGLEPIRQRFAQFPKVYKGYEKKALETSLLTIWQNVPGYPQAKPGGWYVRTGLLGRSMGVTMEGTKSGPPDIYEVKQGSGHSEAAFGSNVYYAPDVIGEKQDPFFAGRGWWNIEKVANLAKGKITKVWQAMADELAAYLDGRR